MFIFGGQLAGQRQGPAVIFRCPGEIDGSNPSPALGQQGLTADQTLGPIDLQIHGRAIDL